MTVYYHGDLLEDSYLGWIELKSSSFWYPRFDNQEKAAFGLIFRTPSKYDLISVGELINSVERDEFVITTWMCNTPSRNVSFYIGKYDKYELKSENSFNVSVFTSDYAHQKINPDYIAQDIASSITLFSELYGFPPISSIKVTEIPYSHSEAFPGLVHLSWNTALQSYYGSNEVIRAHEAAHQWWGIGVDFDTYHDQWLSEGLATYSGLWYLQAAKNDNELFFDILTKWKDQILNVRKYLFGSGQEAGPIWLGYRTSSSDTRGDYNLIIYKKGAWVIHMLRALLLDLNSMNEDRMKNMMRDFYKTYKNKYASTEDFKSIVDKHFGEDMSWFFDQYVFGTDIPFYKVAYKTTNNEEGRTIITIRIRQEEVPEDFKMYVPVKIILDGDRIGRIRIEVKGKETIYTSPPIEGNLKELIFNDLESVLCEVDYEGWN
jgi:aminopeptidase N